jgi:putative acetyltransferase
VTTIRPEAPADRDAVRRVVREAFVDHPDQVVAMVDQLNESGSTRASLLAEVAGEVVGHVQLSRSWVDARERLVEVLVLSPLGVLPSRQRSGIGTALLAAAVDAARESGAAAVFLEGSPAYYSARGFTKASTLGFERPSVRIPDPAFQVVVLDSHEEWMTGRFVYCEAFWAVDCVGLRDPFLAELEQMFDSDL